MATPQEIQRLLAELQRSYERLGQTNPFENFDTSSITDTVATARQLESALTGVRARLRDMSSELDGIVGAFQSTVNEMSKSNTALNDTQKSFRGLTSLAQQLRNDQEGINRLNEKDLKSIISKIQAKKKELKDNKTQLELRKEALILENKSQDVSLSQKRKNREEIGRINKAINSVNAEYREGIGLSQESIDQAQERAEQEENINKALGATPAILGGIGKQLQKLGLPDFGIDDAVEKTKEILRNEEGRVTAGKALSVFSSQMKKNLLAQITPANLIQLAITEIFTALKGADKATGELAKNMNMTYSEASAMRMELNTAANLSGDVFVNTKGMQESLMTINSTLGTNVMLNEQNLVTFTKLREAAGFTNEELMGMQSLANATGGNLEDMTGEFLAQARITATQNKAVLNEKQLMKEISQVSAATTLSFSKNPGLIAEAVATAKSLGMEMSKVEAIADSLLNFEQSIENELQAELLLGKNINLEKARQAALNNDLKTVAEEIAKQAGSSEEFARMNRIQQEALAGAVGMSREELAKSLFLQEQIGNVSAEGYNLRKKQVEELEAKGLSQEQIKEELRKTSVEDLQNQASVQDRLNASVEKLRELFISIADPVMQIISPIVDILTPAVGVLGQAFTALGVPLGFAAKILSNIVGYIKDSLPLMSALVAGATTYFVLKNKSYLMAKKEAAVEFLKNTYQKASIVISRTIEAIKTKGFLKTIGEAAMSAYTSVAKIPFIGPVLGVAAAAGAAALGYQYLSDADDFQQDGYGKRTMFSPEGAIRFNDNDTIIAGTNLGLNKPSQPQSQQPVVVQNDNTESKRTNMLLEQILTKQGTVKMDATEVGTAFSVNTYNVQ